MLLQFLLEAIDTFSNHQEERWDRLSESIDLMFAQVGGIEKTQQQMASQIDLSTQIMDQVCHSHDLCVDAEMPEVVAREVFDDLPRWDDEATWLNHVAFRSPVVSIPAAMEEVHGMPLMGSSSADLEQVAFQPLVVSSSIVVAAIYFQLRYSIGTRHRELVQKLVSSIRRQWNPGIMKLDIIQ